MNLRILICLANIAAAVLFSIIFEASTSVLNHDILESSFAFLDVVSAVVCGIDLLIAFIFSSAKRKQTALSFLLSAILLLIIAVIANRLTV
jgi:hypothetical protein